MRVKYVLSNVVFLMVKKRFFYKKNSNKENWSAFFEKPPEISLISVLNKQCSNNKIIKLSTDYQLFRKIADSFRMVSLIYVGGIPSLNHVFNVYD